MKTKVVIFTLISCLLFSVDVSAKDGKGLKKFWNGVKKAGGFVVGAVAGDVGEKLGIGRETGEALAQWVSNNNEDVQRGMNWSNAEDQYQKKNVVKDYAFDAIAANSKNPEVIELARRAYDTELNYMSDKHKATSQEECNEALTKRVLALYDIGYEVNEMNKERKRAQLAQRLKEKLELEEQMGQYGGDDFKYENYLIAIVNSNDITEAEKREILSQSGLRQSPDEIIAAVKSTNDEDNEAEMRRQEELRKQEEARIAEEKRQAEIRAAEEKKKQDAMNALASTKVEKFKFNDTNLTEEQKQELDNAADILNRYSDVKICITGHTCSLGTESVNERVGMKRAEAGKAYLVEKGVSSERIILESKGETEPIAPNAKDSMSQNRRIEIKVIK